MQTNQTTFWTRIGLWAAVAVTSLVFIQTITYSFQPYWDDNLHVLRNPLLNPVTSEHVARFWLEPYGQLYIPLAYTLWAVQAIISDWLLAVPFHPGLFHFTNTALHIGSVAMVFTILLRLPAFGPQPGTAPWRPALAAGLAALVFACHPLQAEPVAWISGLRDVLGGLLGFIALWLFILTGQHNRTSIKWTLYSLSTLAYLAALGSKPGMVVVPPIALLLGAFLLRFPARFLTATLVPWFVIGGIWALLTGHAQPAAQLAKDLVPVWVRPFVAADATAFYLRKLLWPINLCAEYGQAPNVVMDSGRLFWTWSIPLAATAALASFRQLRWLLVPFLIFVAGLGPTLGLLPFNYQMVSTVADRYTYFAMFGPALAVGLLAIRLKRSPLILLACVVAGLVLRTAFQLPTWKDGQSLFGNAIRINPGSWKAQENFGCVLDDTGDTQAAIVHLAESIRLRPSNFEAYNDLGSVLAHQHRYKDSEACFEQSLQIYLSLPTLKNLISLLIEDKRPDKALKAAKAAEPKFRAAGQIEAADWIRDAAIPGLADLVRKQGRP